MRRFYVAPESIDDRIVVFDEEQAWHIHKVLRLKIGDRLLAFDGTGRQYIVRLIGREKDQWAGQIEDVSVLPVEPGLKLSLVQGIAKGDKMDMIVQKAVEIGVSSIYPVITRHTVVRLDKERAEKKVDRWQVIAREACKQCRSNVITQIQPVMELPDFFLQMGNNPAIMLYENEEHTRLRDILYQNSHHWAEGSLFLLIGPEGGFSSGEVEEAQQRDVLMAGLGPRILRTETAGLVAASLVMYEFGQLG